MTPADPPEFRLSDAEAGFAGELTIPQYRLPLRWKRRRPHFILLTMLHYAVRDIQPGLKPHMHQAKGFPDFWKPRPAPNAENRFAQFLHSGFGMQKNSGPVRSSAFRRSLWERSECKKPLRSIFALRIFGCPICIKLRVFLIFENPVRRGFAVWDSQGTVV